MTDFSFSLFFWGGEERGGGRVCLLAYFGVLGLGVVGLVGLWFLVGILV